jgi:hypothetical protein
MAHKHSVYDTDPHFVIDPVTRAIRNASTSKTKLIQYDHNSERFTFEIQRFVDGHDMSLCDAVEIHYQNSDSVTKESYEGLYAVMDLQVSPDDDHVVIGSWLISRNATQYVGTLQFQMRFVCVTDGEVDYDWHTDIHTGIVVSKGMHHSDDIATAYADVIAQVEAKVGEIEEEINSTVTAIDFSDFDNGSFTETINGEVITHAVTFDDAGRPVSIDGITITWGDS